MSSKVVPEGRHVPSRTWMELLLTAFPSWGRRGLRREEHCPAADLHRHCNGRGILSGIVFWTA